MSRAFPGFDVVAVPDFSTPARSTVFEARTLFFLASWLENAGEAKAFPLCLACIGEPPASVRRLASRCGAAVEVCEPLGLTGSLTANKLRGLEIAGRAERILMLDTDVFILGDFSDLAAIVPSGLAAAPAGSKWVPEALWQKIYPHLDLPLPGERTPMLRAEYGLLPSARTLHAEFGGTTDLNRMLPYYNSGVFITPRDSGLRAVWADHLVRLAALFGDRTGSRAEGGHGGRFAFDLDRHRAGLETDHDPAREISPLGHYLRSGDVLDRYPATAGGGSAVPPAARPVSCAPLALPGWQDRLG